MLDMESETVRGPLWPLLVYIGTFAFLAVPLVIGSPGARLGTLGAAGGMLAAAAAGLHVTRAEHADDQRRPGFAALAREAAAEAGRPIVYVAVYMLIVFLAAFAPGSGPRADSGATGVIIAMGAAAVLVATMVDIGTTARKREGIERAVFVESTSWAFFATMAVTGTYGLAEVFMGAPKLSAWSAWPVGMLTWVVTQQILERRAR